VGRGARCAGRRALTVVRGDLERRPPISAPRSGVAPFESAEVHTLRGIREETPASARIIGPRITRSRLGARACLEAVLGEVVGAGGIRRAPSRKERGARSARSSRGADHRAYPLDYSGSAEGRRLTIPCTCEAGVRLSRTREARCQPLAARGYFASALVPRTASTSTSRGGSAVVRFVLTSIFLSMADARREVWPASRLRQPRSTTARRSRSSSSALRGRARVLTSRCLAADPRPRGAHRRGRPTRTSTRSPRRSARR